MSDDGGMLQYWLGLVEASSIATWVRESGSIWGYPTILTLHTAGLGILVGANAALDLRLLGAGRGIPIPALAVLFRWMGVGLAMNASTGALLFMADATVKAYQTIFLIKLALIAAALVALARLRRYFARDAAPLADGIVSAEGRVLAWASLLLWAAAITAGRLMAYLQ